MNCLFIVISVIYIIVATIILVYIQKKFKKLKSYYDNLHGINIVNKSDINTKKIYQFLNTLPKEYQELDVEIRIYKNKWSLIRTVLNIFELSTGLKGLFLTLKNKVIGGLSDDGRVIEIYLFKAKKYKTQYFISTLLHELRHKYQQIHFPDMFCDSLSQYNKLYDNFNANEYLSLETEDDAYKFSYEYYTNNKQKINKLFNLKDDYTVDTYNDIHDK